MSVAKLKAVLWLHALRLWRFKFSFLDMALSTTIWVTVFLLAALMFIPRGELPKVLPLVFWGIVMWNVASSATLLIGGWTHYYVSAGLFEEHAIVGISSALFLSGRALTGLSMSAMAIGFAYVVLSAMAGESVLVVANSLALAFGFIIVVIMAFSQGLIVSAISLRAGVSHVLLEIINLIMFIVGGFITPVRKLPDPLRYIALFIPYCHPAELVRYGAAYVEPYLPLWITAAISVVLGMIMLTLATLSMRLVESRIKKHGLKAVGRM